ncbi:Gp42 (endogenous virus) [Propionibacterium phage PAS50]|uniref:Gp42 n=1 Tax=Propionibacterium phage PAS50 TaxID=504553 RepID=F4MIN2_9CAUD|nr:Gp42 [Propionibacterium phage PAS50]ACX30881.1 Gp42 [Propionibacterium phage PAS50]
MQWTCHKCDSTIIGYRPEHCTVCHETYNGTCAGDMHRTGDHGVKTGPNRRRCLTMDEMHAKGMTRNPHGYWTRGQTSSYVKDKTPSHTRNAQNN